MRAPPHHAARTLLALTRAPRVPCSLSASVSARPGYLYGLPVVVKDTMPLEGVRFTNGSALVDCVAARSDLTVRILEANGAICLGKSNTPEFAAGSNTFNALFGATVNPFDTRMTCGGSSGGSGAALAAGMCFGATGSDLGGSLRIPASFCGVVGLRPAPGRVPRGPVASPLDRLAVNGPMGRDVLDTALMLDAMVAPAGGEGEGKGEGEGAAAMVMADPLALPAPRESFAAAAARAAPPARVAWSRDLGGISPVEPEVADVCERAARLFGSELGASVEDACVDLSDAEALFRTLRADGMARTFEEVVADPEKRAILKPDLLWNIDYGLKKQSAADVRAAQRAHAALIYRAAAFFEEYDVLATPCVMTAPFDVNVPWLKVRARGGAVAARAAPRERVTGTGDAPRGADVPALLLVLTHCHTHHHITRTPTHLPPRRSPGWSCRTTPSGCA